MTSKTVRAAAYAPDGTEITYTSPPNKWDVAGIARNSSGQWSELAHGGSYDSVRSRAITRAYRGRYDSSTVTAVRIYEATAPCVRAYFGHHKVSITDVFQNGVWRHVSLHGGWSNIRKQSLRGVTAIAFEGVGRHGNGPVIADFQVSELLKSMRLPGQKMCATPGHEHIPATQKITWAHTVADEMTTEFVCNACATITSGGVDVCMTIPLAR